MCLQNAGELISCVSSVGRDRAEVQTSPLWSHRAWSSPAHLPGAGATPPKADRPAGHPPIRCGGYMYPWIHHTCYFASAHWTPASHHAFCFSVDDTPSQAQQNTEMAVGQDGRSSCDQCRRGRVRSNLEGRLHQWRLPCEATHAGANNLLHRNPPGDSSGKLQEVLDNIHPKRTDAMWHSRLVLPSSFAPCLSAISERHPQ